MPRVFLTAKDKLKAAYEDRDAAFQECLLVRLKRRSMPQKDLEPLMGLSHATTHRKLKNPELLTIGQVRVIFDTLGFTDEERLSLVGRGKVKGGIA